MYFTNDKGYTDRKLDVLKRRNCGVQVKKIKTYDNDNEKTKANLFRNKYLF